MKCRRLGIRLGRDLAVSLAIASIIFSCYSGYIQPREADTTVMSVENDGGVDAGANENSQPAKQGQECDRSIHRVSSTVSFAENSSSIQESDREILTGISAGLDVPWRELLSIKLSGYSFHDSRPEKVIALERAESVKRRLVECGFAPELIKTVGIAGPPAFYRDGHTGEYHDHDPRELRIVEIEVRYEEIVCVD